MIKAGRNPGLNVLLLRRAFRVRLLGRLSSSLGVLPSVRRVLAALHVVVPTVLTGGGPMGLGRGFVMLGSFGMCLVRRVCLRWRNNLRFETLIGFLVSPVLPQRVDNKLDELRALGRIHSWGREGIVLFGIITLMLVVFDVWLYAFVRELRLRLLQNADADATAQAGGGGWPSH
jgi:hypothetical protein